MPSPYADLGPERTEKTVHYQRLNSWIDQLPDTPEKARLRQARKQYRDNRRKTAWQPRESAQ